MFFRILNNFVVIIFAALASWNLDEQNYGTALFMSLIALYWVAIAHADAVLERS